jgi:putative endonuclease
VDAKRQGDVMRQKLYFVYILTSSRGTLYTGVTSNLVRRVSQHRSGVVSGFTSRYRVHRLIYFEETTDVQAALHREKQIKAWSRKEKLKLIRTMNPRFTDLWEEFEGD